MCYFLTLTLTLTLVNVAPNREILQKLYYFNSLLSSVNS